MGIIRDLPDEVVPKVLPQLQEIAEYETRMWRIRQEPVKPELTTTWISLPITT